MTGRHTRSSFAARALIVTLALYGGLRVANTGWLFLFERGGASRVAETGLPALSPDQQPIVSALTRLLELENVGEPARWAAAIVRSCPTTDVGYVALVTAQIRRESNFLAKDLEWLYESLVPELCHELGIERHTRTIGPMQIQRRHLAEIFRRSLGHKVEPSDLEDLALDLELGVAAAVAVLDGVVTEYVPDRKLQGWADAVGMTQHRTERVLARSWSDEVTEEEASIAATQKLLSDLTGVPLALDGALGSHTKELTALFESVLPNQSIQERWEEVFGARAPARLEPRIAHDSPLGFIVADFTSGLGSSRIAALQVLLNETVDADLVADGKFGPVTRAACSTLFERHLDNPRRVGELQELLRKGHKPGWVRSQALQLASRVYRLSSANPAPEALIPNLSYYRITQRIKGLGRMSVEAYVSGSVTTFEDYYSRLSTFIGKDVPQSRLRS